MIHIFDSEVHKLPDSVVKYLIDNRWTSKIEIHQANKSLNSYILNVQKVIEKSIIFQISLSSSAEDKLK